MRNGCDPNEVESVRGEAPRLDDRAVLRDTLPSLYKHGVPMGCFTSANSAIHATRLMRLTAHLERHHAKK